jgi:hypothetical protein
MLDVLHGVNGTDGCERNEVASVPNRYALTLGRNTYFMACMADKRVVLFRVSRWGLVRDALK